MQTQPAPIKVRKPPAALFRYLVNPLMVRLLRTSFGARRIGTRLMLMRFAGRASGRTFELPVGYQRTSSGIVSFTHSAWWRNLQGNVPVEVLLQGTWHTGRGSATRDPRIVLPRFLELIERDGPQASARYGLPLPKERELSPDEMRTAIQAVGLALVRVELDTAPVRRFVPGVGA